jgi:predicted PhzF superfamily epimerase YddE/YHI9
LDLELRGVVVTAPGDHVDFVSRCFFPKLRVNEDPVTGSAHCELAPYWGKRLGLKNLKAKQISKRTGRLECALVKNRVILSGNAVSYMQGQIII